MAVNKKLLQGAAAAAPGGITPSEHFGVVLYEGDGASSHSINGGKFGAGANFSSGNAAITLDNNIIDTDDHSVSVWFYMNNTSGIQNVFEFDYTNRILFRAASTDSNWAYIGNSGYFNHGISLSANQWYHLVITFKTGSPFKIYVNGALEYTGGNTSKFANNVDNIIGAASSTGSGYIDGKLDQLRIFHKELSSSEVSTLYAETASTVESLDPLSEDTTDTLQVLGDSSCIATYRFENNEDDESGNFDGTGTEIQYAAGRYGQAASFNGTASRISTSLDFDNYDENWSISYWIKFTFNSNYRAILGSTDSNSYNGMVSDIGTSGEIRFRLRDATGSESRLSSTGTYGDGNWHHVVCVKHSSSNHLYIDGKLDSSTATTNGINHSALNLGTYGLSSTEFFKGELDQVRIFNKAISAAEVTTLYNENSLVASYRFEGNANDDTRNYDGTASNVTYEYGLNFTPDFVWLKSRSGAVGDFSHTLMDSTRGASKSLSSNNNNAEVTNSNGLESFDTGGFTVGSAAGGWNYDGTNYVGWCWKANGGTTSSNTDGTITSTVQANTDAGFSIVTWTSTSTISDTIGHGLNSKPDVVLYKKRSSTGSWFWYTDLIDGSWDELVLNSTDAKSDFAGTYATSTTFKSVTSSSGADWVTYCFHSVDGFSKFGTYTGTGSATDRPIIETGFEPAFVMIKSASTGGTTPYHWNIYDNKRNKTNSRDLILEADTSDADLTASTTYIDFLSNGFQIGPTTSGRNNGSGVTYIYMAFAADPDTEAPAVAKSFSTVAYDGTGSAQTIEGLGFSPSLVWIKNRAAANSHNIYDTVRGATKLIESDTSDAEVTSSTGLTAFTDDGFTVSTGSGVNNATGDYVAWAFKADDNEPAINTEGSIDSLVSANANAGFSIVKYEGNGSAGATIGHNLSAAPEMVIIKNLDSAVDWRVGHTSAGWTKFGKLNTTDAFSTSSVAWNDTAPSSTVVTLGTSSGLNSSGVNYIAYCFHSVSGFSKIGSYTGSGGSNTQSVNVGFQADWVMIKDYNVGGSWWIIDSVRGGSKEVRANVSNAESTNNYVTFTSTGFDVTGGLNSNSSSSEFIYAAFKIN